MCTLSWHLVYLDAQNWEWAAFSSFLRGPAWGSLTIKSLPFHYTMLYLQLFPPNIETSQMQGARHMLN